MTPLVVLCYHRVLSERDREGPGRPYFARGTAISTENFRRQVSALAQRFEVVDEATAIDVVVGRDSGTSRRPRCWLTVDDGYADAHDAMLSILGDYGMTATVFLVPPLHGETPAVLPVDRWYATLEARTHARGVLRMCGAEWGFDATRPRDYARLIDGPEKRAFLRASASEQDRLLRELAAAVGATAVQPAESRYLSRAQLVALRSAGWTFGSHTTHHRLLGRTSRDEAIEELAGSRVGFPGLGLPVPSALAYPDGNWSPTLWPLVEEAGYELALTIQPGVVTSGNTPRYAVPRYIVPDDGGWVERVLLPEVDGGVR